MSSTFRFLAGTVLGLAAGCSEPEPPGPSRDEAAQIYLEEAAKLDQLKVEVDRCERARLDAEGARVENIEQAKARDAAFVVTDEDDPLTKKYRAMFKEQDEHSQKVYESRVKEYETNKPRLTTAVAEQEKRTEAALRELEAAKARER